MSLGIVQAGTASGRGTESLSLAPTCMIVEDRVMIALSLEAYLEEIGFGGCETFPSGAEALEWLTANSPTVAILDYSLKDGPCTCLVRTLQERGIPFVIYSGHRRTVALPELQGVPWLNKPCDRPALLAALIHAAPALTEWKTKAAV